MSDQKLFSEFPPVTTAQWEEQIALDLKLRKEVGVVHGAPAMWDENSSAGDGWMLLMMFVRMVKDEKYK